MAQEVMNYALAYKLQKITHKEVKNMRKIEFTIDNVAKWIKENTDWLANALITDYEVLEGLEIDKDGEIKEV